MNNVHELAPKPVYTITKKTVYEVFRNAGGPPVLMEQCNSLKEAEDCVEFNQKEDLGD